jgi:integral membrane sensor domain MASE1
MRLLRDLLSRQVTVGGALEAALWLGLGYVMIGVVVTFFHPEYVQMLTAQFDSWLPAGGGLAAFGQITMMWPGILLAGDLCMY